MLDELQKAKLVEWAEWVRANGFSRDGMPKGIREMDKWTAWPNVPFPTFDRDEPYTFGEDHG